MVKSAPKCSDSGICGLMRFGKPVKNHQGSVRGYCNSGAGSFVDSALKVKSAVQALPTVALNIFVLKKSTLVYVKHMTQIILISGKLFGHLPNIFGQQVVPDPRKLGNIPPHHAGVECDRVQALQISKVSYAPEVVGI